MVPTKNKGHVRSFSIDDHELDDLVTRSNERYDILIDIIHLQKDLRDLWPRQRQSKEPPVDKRNEKGLMGICLLRELTYFDVGRSFMADSLHNIYIGAFVNIKFCFCCHSCTIEFLEKNDWTLAQRRV